PSSFPRPLLVALVIGLIAWGNVAKITRAQTLTLKGLDYVAAARPRRPAPGSQAFVASSWG
ncbi:hypothetical protein ACWGL3_29190, partial [Nocardiopsis sp. NPDC055824]